MSNTPRRTANLAIALLLSALLSACGSGGSDGGTDSPTGPSASPGAAPDTVANLSLSADRNVTSTGGEPVTLSASASGTRQEIAWTLESGSPGRLTSTSGTTVHYLPPPSDSIQGSIVVNVIASSGDLNKKISIVLEGTDIPPGAAPPDTVVPSRLAITADSGRVEPGGNGVTLSALSPASPDQVQWSLEAGSPGTLSASSGASVVYQPPAVAGVRETQVTVVATSDGQSARYTILLQGQQGLALLAGNDFGPGMRDGAGASARFSQPMGIARDADGNVYVADRGNHSIRRVAPDNSVSTIAGMPGTAGHVDGSGSAARLNAPEHLELGADGNLYFTDTRAHTLRRVTPGGVVTTVAGLAGTPGDADGPAAAARFNHPAGVGSDADGNLYVADTFNSLVRRFTSGGLVDTYAGIRGQRSLVNGAAGSASFIDPMALTLDPLGNLFVSDGFFRPPEPNTIAGRSVIRKVAPDGSTSTLAGGFIPETAQSVDGTGADARFFGISGMTADSVGNLTVADGRIRQVTPAGVVTTFLARAPGQLNTAGDVAFDGAGTLTFSDSGDHVLRAVSPSGAIDTLAGAAPRAGSADGAGAAAQFYAPKGIASDAAGNLVVADMFNHTIRMLTPAGVVTTRAGNAGNPGSIDGNGAAARFSYPHDVAVDAAGNLFVSDSFNHTIRRIAPNGNVTTFAGSPGALGHADGSGSAARFASPDGVAVDADGNVYVADRMNHVLRRISTQGVVTTLAGSPGGFGHADGSGSAARFNAPSDLTIDAAGNLYLLDGSSMVRRVTPDGVVTTLAGAPVQWGRSDGTGANARFQAPEGITLGSDGNLYVADTQNHAIRRVTPQGVVTTVAGVGAPDQLAQDSLYRPQRIAALQDRVLAVVAGNGVFRLTLP